MYAYLQIIILLAFSAIVIISDDAINDGRHHGPKNS
jgi:hypothetical protein